MLPQPAHPLVWDEMEKTVGVKPADGAAEFTFNVTNNDVRQYNSSGIEFIAGSGEVGGGQMNLNISGNSLGNSGTNPLITLLQGIRATVRFGYLALAGFAALAGFGLWILRARLGLLSPGAGINASFARVTPSAGPIALVAQSGAVAAAALDWAPHGLRFNCVCPGSTDTPMLACRSTTWMRTPPKAFDRFSTASSVMTLLRPCGCGTRLRRPRRWRAEARFPLCEGCRRDDPSLRRAGAQPR